MLKYSYLEQLFYNFKIKIGVWEFLRLGINVNPGITIQKIKMGHMYAHF